jgi:hypothetical protein
MARERDSFLLNVSAVHSILPTILDIVHLILGVRSRGVIQLSLIATYQRLTAVV